MFEQLKDPTAQELTFGITRLKALGLTALNFCGGEPLLRTDLAKLFRHMKMLSIETILSTNGDLLEKRIGGFEGILDWIALPLDGGLPEHHDRYRGPGSFSRFPCKVELVRQKLPSTGIKINTVVTSRNIKNIPQIPRILSSMGVRLKWKIIQFSPRGRARDRQNGLAVSNDDFSSLASRLLHENPNLDIDVSLNSDRDCGCVILDQIGNMQVPIGDSYRFLGNIFEINLEEFLSRPAQKDWFLPDKNRSLHKRSYGWRELKSRLPVI